MRAGSSPASGIKMIVLTPKEVKEEYRQLPSNPIIYAIKTESYWYFPIYVSELKVLDIPWMELAFIEICVVLLARNESNK